MGNEHAIMPYPNWGANQEDCGIDQGTPNGDRFCAAHCDMVLREHIWFWQPNPPPITNITQMISMYLTSIGRGCNLILDMAPNTTGLLLEDDIKQYQLFGDTLRAMFFNASKNYTLVIDEENPNMLKNISKDGSEIIYRLKLDDYNVNDIKLGIGAVELREDIRNGQRIEKYLCQIHDGQADLWYNLTETMMSLTVGNKRIQTYNVSKIDGDGDYDEIRITIYSYIGGDPNLVELKSITMYDWTFISQNQLTYLDWNSVIKAGQ